MIYILMFVTILSFATGTIIFYRFSQVERRSTQAPFTPMYFFDALFFGLGSKRDMNIAAFSFMVFLLSIWGLTYIKQQGEFWGSPNSYFGLGIAGIFFLIMHCRYGAKNITIKHDGLAPMKELINFRKSGLISPFLWLSRLGYLGCLVGISH